MAMTTRPGRGVIPCSRSRCRDQLYSVTLVTEKGAEDWNPADENVVALVCFTCRRYLFARPWWS